MSAPSQKQQQQMEELQLQQEANSKTRKELQTLLKSMGRTATGSNAKLKEQYIEARRAEQGLASSAQATCTASASSGAAATAAAAAPKKNPTPKKAAAAVEKRQRRFRNHCPIAVQQRIDRARSQRLYLVERKPIQDTEWHFVVLGSTGNVYTVRITHLPSCSCPDHQKGNVCKHMLFVWIKVMGMDENSPLIYQNALLTSELEDAFAQMQQRISQVGGGGGGGGVMANAQVLKTYQKLTSPQKAQDKEDSDTDDNDGKVKRQAVEGDCPICFDALVSGSTGSLVFCKAACGANFHADCITQWKRNSCRGGSGKGVTCPNCRSEWLEDNGGANSKKEYGSPEGYTNLGSLQGQSARRDTSTYSEWFGSNKRRRR